MIAAAIAATPMAGALRGHQTTASVDGAGAASGPSAIPGRREVGVASSRIHALRGDDEAHVCPSFVGGKRICGVVVVVVVMVVVVNVDGRWWMVILVNRNGNG